MDESNCVVLYAQITCQYEHLVASLHGVQLYVKQCVKCNFHELNYVISQILHNYANISSKFMIGMLIHFSQWMGLFTHYYTYITHYNNIYPINKETQKWRP